MQRHQLAGFLGGYLFEVDAEIAALGDDAAQPVHARLGRRQQHAAGQVHAGRLAGQFLDLLVEADRVFLQLGDVGVAVDRVHAAGGMPGRARRQLVALDEHDVGPAVPGQMEQHRAADDAASDDHDLRMRFHEESRCFSGLEGFGELSGRESVIRNVSRHGMSSVSPSARWRHLANVRLRRWRHPRADRGPTKSIPQRSPHGSPSPIASLRLAT